MKNKQVTLIIVVIVFLVSLTACTGKKKIKDPVFSALMAVEETIEKDEDSISFLFHENRVVEKSLFTKQDFSSARLRFTPWREKDIDSSFSLFLQYKDKDNFYRMNIFSGSGKVHFFKKEGKKITTLFYDRVDGYNSINRLENIFTVNLNENAVTCSVNDKIFCTENLEYKKGKIGFGAYGKQESKAQFIFSFSE